MGRWNLPNKAKQRKLESGEALDVNFVGAPIVGWPRHYKLQTFEEGMDYCDARGENWIWSIARREGTNDIVASFDSDMYLREGWICLFLR
jgi:hypothetical protein